MLKLSWSCKRPHFAEENQPLTNSYLVFLAIAFIQLNYKVGTVHIFVKIFSKCPLRLTSPLSDSRCCWRELASLTNRLLSPTRSARFPMTTLRWPRWTSPLDNLPARLFTLYVFPFTSTMLSFFLSFFLRHWHTLKIPNRHRTFQTHNCTSHPPWTRTHVFFFFSQKSGLDQCQSEQVLK